MAGLRSAKGHRRPSQKKGSRILLTAGVFLAVYLWMTMHLHLTVAKWNQEDAITPALEQQRLTLESLGAHQDSSNVVAIASTITGCGVEPFTEGAAVLKYSIDLTSTQGPKGGKYDYQFYILYHPDAKECALPLRDLGFTLIERPTPVNVSEIQGDVLRERIEKNGCCGEKELLKLEAFRLTRHPVVVHLDLDVLVMKPMDDVIDLLLNPSRVDPNTTNVPLMWPEKPIPSDVRLVHTTDYNVVAPRRPDKPYQGGFFAIKPSLETYTEIVNIVKEGDYVDEKKRKGWGGIVGPFYGGMTIQGIFPWYFGYVKKGFSVELNRCAYNNIADNPTNQPTVDNVVQGMCRTNQEVCEDCRTRSVDQITTFHYTACYKPWNCARHGAKSLNHRLCREMNQQWYSYRSAMEKSWGRIGYGNATMDSDIFYGYCSKGRYTGYEHIKTPYGKP